MNYNNLKWSALKSYASKQGINTKGKTKVDIIKALDDSRYEVVELPTDIDLKESAKDKPDFGAGWLSYEGIKQLPEVFTDDSVKKILPSLKAYNKLKSISALEEINKLVGVMFLKYIETDKNAVINPSCTGCTESYYKRFIHNYNILALEHGEPTI